LSVLVCGNAIGWKLAANEIAVEIVSFNASFTGLNTSLSPGIVPFSFSVQKSMFSTMIVLWVSYNQNTLSISTKFVSFCALCADTMFIHCHAI
jgi:hypothetical protein